MCVSPRQIINPKFKGGTFRNDIDPLFVVVPCGHCYECMLQLQQMWICRNYHQYLINTGTIFYYTLTYNEDKIMRVWSWKKGNSLLSSTTNIPNPFEVTKFLKRLSARLRRKGVFMKYFLVTERGDKKLRPHHHVLFYLDKHFDAKEFYNLVNSTWNNGFIKTGDNLGIVNSPYALFYCCKYIAKFGKKKTFVSPTNIQSYRAFTGWFNRHFGNFRRVSSRLGWSSYIARCITDINLINGSLKVPLDGQIKDFPMPQYYYRKLCCTAFKNPHGNISFKPNKKGWSFTYDQFNKLYDKTQLSCDKVNNRYGTDFSADEIFTYRLFHGMPLSMINQSFYDLFCWRKNNTGDVGDDYLDPENRYYCDKAQLERIKQFNYFNSIISYEKYKKNSDAYNVRQRVRYRGSPKEIKTLNFNQYVNVNF